MNLAAHPRVYSEPEKTLGAFGLYPAFPATNTDAVNSAATCETVAEVSELPEDVLKTHGAARGLYINCAVQLDD